MAPLRRLVSVALLVFLAGCATARNYLEADRPVYEAAFGLPDGPVGEGPSVLRVVTLNVEQGENVLQTIELLRSRPALAGADVLLLQEMQAPGVEAIARALSLNAVYYPASHHTRQDRDIGNAVLSPWPDPVLVAGDFNSKGMAEWLAEHGFDWPTRDVGRTTTLLSFSFDHVLVRGLETAGDPGAGVVRDVRGISDHYPVWVKLRLDADPLP
jgi:endonuclease/exonuclease/phosphatase family metal-dependent hydrolase